MRQAGQHLSPLWDGLGELKNGWNCYEIAKIGLRISMGGTSWMVISKVPRDIASLKYRRDSSNPDSLFHDARAIYP
jgi:hypothetical protein